MEADPCIYYKWDSNRVHLQLISLYVDNLGIAGDLQTDVDLVRSQLQDKFKMTDEPSDQFLQIKLEIIDGAYCLSQTQSIDNLLVTTNMDAAEPASTPMETLTVSKDDCPVVGSDEWHHMQLIPHRETIGSLSDIARHTHPETAYAVSVASRYLAQQHWNIVKRILRYLKGTRDWVFRVLHFLQQTSNSTTVDGLIRFQGFSDSD